MVTMKMIKSVTRGPNAAVMIEKDGSYGVFQGIASVEKLCFYDDKILADEVFEFVAKEVMETLEN